MQTKSSSLYEDVTETYSRNGSKASVSSWPEYEKAEHDACSVAGVTEIEN